MSVELFRTQAFADTDTLRPFRQDSVEFMRRIQERENPRHQITHFESPVKRRMRIVNDALAVQYRKSIEEKQKTKKEGAKGAKHRIDLKRSIERLLKYTEERWQKIEFLKKEVGSSKNRPSKKSFNSQTIGLQSSIRHSSPKDSLNMSLLIKDLTCYRISMTNAKLTDSPQ